jgi:hypothetical protein
MDAYAQWQAGPPARPAHVPPQPGTIAPGRSFGPGPAGSEATRLLCAGMYLDPGFRDRVIEELVGHEERPVAPSLGIDAVPVLAHAVRARRHEMLTAALLLLVWIAFFAATPLAITGPASDSSIYPDPSSDGSSSVPWWGALAGLVSWAGAYAWVCLWLWIARTAAGRNATVYAADRATGVRPGWVRRWAGRALTFAAWIGALSYWLAAVAAVSSGSTGNPGPLLFPLLIAAVTALPKRWVVSVFRDELHPDSFARRPRATLPDTVRYRRIGTAIDREQFSALTIYDPFRPFIGAGIAHEPWSFAMELKRKNTDAASPAPRITSRQILDLIRPQLERLKQSSATSRDRLRELEIQECVFLPAGLSREELAAGYRPESVGAHLAEAVDEGGEARRLFLRIRVGAWDEQVVTTILVRVHTQGGLLVLEVAPHILTPVRPDFKVADAIATGHGEGLLRLGVRALVAAPTASVSAGISAVRGIGSAFRMWLSDPQHAYPDGPAASVREMGSVPEVRLFQEMDVSRYVKTIQDRVVNGVREALRSQGYDTGEFEQHVVNVSGNGVFIGGSIKGGAIATGQGATATHTDGSA